MRQQGALKGVSVHRKNVQSAKRKNKKNDFLLIKIYS